jgi:DNA-binding GntR family transcriptional regulator
VARAAQDEPAQDETAQDNGAATPRRRATANPSVPGRKLADRSSQIRSITPPSIPALVSSELRRRIASGRLQPGPLKISDLAQEFGVSAVPVREALRMLEMEGLVTFDHNRSVHVKALSLEDLHEIYDMRMLLEPLLLGRAVPRLRADRERLTRLEELLEAMDDSSDVIVWADTNTEFHWECYEASDMPRLKNIVSSLWTAVEPFMRLYATSPDGMGLAQREHRDLLKHIKSGNVPKVEETTRHHLKDTLAAIESRLLDLGGKAT